MEQGGDTSASGRQVARGAIGMVGLKVAYSALGFSLGVLLARLLGAEGYGRYTYAMSWAVFLGAPAALGLDKLVVRQVAVDRARGDWRHFRGLLRSSNRAGLVASLLLAAAAGVIATAAARAGHREAATTVLVGLVMVPILTLMKIRQAALAGLGQVVRGQWPELLVHPAVLMVLVACWWLAGRGVTSEIAMGLTVASSAAMLGLGAWLLHRSTPAKAHQGTGTPVPLPWRQSLMPLTAMATIQSLQGQVDMLLLGLLAPAASVGIYGVASRGGQLVIFFLNAAVPALAPVVASLHDSGDRAGLERVAIRTARTTTLLSLPVAVGLAIWGRWYLLLFGPLFAAGAWPLLILCTGQLVNVACGPVGTVLIMTGHERVVARMVGVAATVNAIVSTALIPHFGPTGAAVGAASSMVVWNVLLVREVRRRLGAHVTCFGHLWGRASKP